MQPFFLIREEIDESLDSCLLQGIYAISSSGSPTVIFVSYKNIYIIFTGKKIHWNVGFRCVFDFRHPLEILKNVRCGFEVITEHRCDFNRTFAFIDSKTIKHRDIF